MFVEICNGTFIRIVNIKNFHERGRIEKPFLKWAATEQNSLRSQGLNRRHAHAAVVRGSTLSCAFDAAVLHGYHGRW